MHGSVMAWTQRKVVELGIGAWPTLEVGSYNVNGSVRDYFTGAYVGVDMAEGPGVDKVMNAEALEYADDEWDVVISTEVLEHCERPWKAMAEMARVCAQGGYVMVSARGFDERGAFALHEYPWDLWRYGPGCMERLAVGVGLEVIECVADPECPGWLLTARKL